MTPAAPSPAPAAELPRTGAGGIVQATFLAMVMLLGSVSARLLGRRRPKAV